MSRHIFGDARGDDDVARRLDLWAIALENAVDTLNRTLNEIKEVQNVQKGQGDDRSGQGRGGERGGGGVDGPAGHVPG